MNTVPCPHCEAPVKPTATFCLACDTPLVDTDRGLSVAEATPVAVGRPWMLVVAPLAILLFVGGATWGGMAFVHARRASSADAATSDVRRAIELLVSAEGGRSGACRDLVKTTAGKAVTVLAECHALVGRDTGLRLDKIEVSTPQLHGQTGRVRVSTTTTDGSGTHTSSEELSLVGQHRGWQVVWSGRPV